MATMKYQLMGLEISLYGAEVSAYASTHIGVGLLKSRDLRFKRNKHLRLGAHHKLRPITPIR